MFYIYVIYNFGARKLYIGQTIDLAARVREHNEGKFGGYTSRFAGEWELIYSEEVSDRSEALKREKQLKSYRGREFIRKKLPP